MGKCTRSVTEVPLVHLLSQFYQHTQWRWTSKRLSFAHWHTSSVAARGPWKDSIGGTSSGSGVPSLRQPSKRGEPAAGGGQQHQASPWRQVLSVTQRAVPSEPPPWARSHGAAPPRGETDASAQHLSHPMAHDSNGVAGGRGDFTRCVPSMDVDSSSDFLYSL